MVKSSYSKKEILGCLGERVVLEFLFKNNLVASQSKNPFDRKKDITVEGKSLEVKAKTRIYSGHSNTFPLDDDQYVKCDNADKFFFVEIPEFENDMANIYEVVDRTAFVEVIGFGGSYTHKDGSPLRTRLYDISKMELIGRCNNRLLCWMLRYFSISKYQKRGVRPEGIPTFTEEDWGTRISEHSERMYRSAVDEVKGLSERAFLSETG